MESMRANLVQVEELLMLDPSNADVLALKTQLTEALALLEGPAPQPQDRIDGRVKFYSQQKGYGFLEPDTGGDDVFVHHSQIRWAHDRVGWIAEGRQLSFVVEPKDNGKLQAVDVTNTRGERVVSDDYPVVLEVGIKSDEGLKDTNEDRWVSELALGDVGSFFAVFDGHSGASASKYAAKHLHMFTVIDYFVVPAVIHVLGVVVEREAAEACVGWHKRVLLPVVR